MNKKIKDLVKKKNKSKIVCLTAYSKKIASILDTHCDIVLVGDSLGSVLYSYKSTKEVTLETMINHSKSVRLGVKKSIMIVDMPYNTYRNPREALNNVKLVIKKTKCDGVKLEGGKKIISIDIRGVTKKEDRQRIIDIVTGLALGKKCTIKQINTDGVFLIIPPSIKK